MCNVDFAEWLNEELTRRGWSQRELARRAHTTSTTVSEVISRKRNPSYDFVGKVARALGEPVEKLERMAGLKDKPRGEDEDLRELYEIAKALNDENREQVTRIASLLLREQRELSREGDRGALD